MRCFKRLPEEVIVNNKIAALVKRGLKVGRNFSMQSSCIIDEEYCWLISIGDDVTLAKKVYIIAHDSSTKLELGYRKIGLVKIGDKTFIGAGCTVLANVKIGANVIIGAGSLVSKDIPDNSIAVGIPAKVIGNTDDYLASNRALMANRPIYDESWTVQGGISSEQKQKMIADLADGIGYVR